MRKRRAELEVRLQECKLSMEANRAESQSWHDEIESMDKQKSSVNDEVVCLEREVEFLRKTAEEQKKQIIRAEAKVKTIDAQRADFRVQGELLVRQSSEYRKSADEAAAAVVTLQNQLEHAVLQTS